MGRYVFKLPDIGEGTAEAELVAWHVAVGDSVEEDQHIADVMTEKATVEIPAPVAGKVVSLTGAPGQMIAVGSEFLVLAVEGRGNADAAPAAEANAEPAAAAAAPAGKAKPAAKAAAPAATAKADAKPAAAAAARPGPAAA